MREEFLKLLIAHPGDISIGLIYADWLEGQGDPEESYWRDLRIYARAFTAICKEYEYDRVGKPSGDGWGAGTGGAEYALGLEDGNGYGCGDLMGYEDGDGVDRNSVWLVGLGIRESGHGRYGDRYGGGRGGGDWHGDGRSGFGEATFLKLEVLMQGRFILVCEQGFVLVGDVSPHPTDWQRVIVDHCATVRIWGTKRGLGQLALEGPQQETVLDYEGNGVDLLRAIIQRAIPCDAAAWEKYPEIVTKKAE